jgi:protein-S-isoprenylcysteine O-methyltransferase Ste14
VELSMGRRIASGLFVYFAFGAIWFGLAGRLTWWQGWAFLLLLMGFVGTLSWRLWQRDPDLLEERNQPAAKAESWDRVVVHLYTVALLVQLVVAALDGGRFGWSTVPLALQFFGWGLLIAAGGLVWGVMMTNAYLSSWARLQSDRGQQVVDRGAYAYIRHPMYLAIIIAFVGLPLALGSWWAAMLSPIIGGLFVVRTALEDQMLMNGLTGYSEYAQRVRYKLVPGIW